ncbi:MAG: hypothetical protein HYT11_04045 [Candidatus Levybacteria bacterium]|nr:hypothetical protein [Candidatus Levybacteria bacterium]
MKVDKAQLNVPDELVDEIVEEILSETKSKKPMGTAGKPKQKDELLLDGDLPDVSKLKLRLQYLENRIEKHVHDYKTTAIETERQIVDKFSEFDQENEKRLMYLQNQLEALRNAMIRLSNEFKQFRESISTQKQ